MKVITMAKQRNKNEGIPWSQWELKVKLPKAREKVNDKVTVGVIFTPDWLRGWEAFSESIKSIVK